jgi:hypothetical protein
VEPPVGGGMGAAGRCIICSDLWHRESKDRHGRVPLQHVRGARQDAAGSPPIGSAFPLPLYHCSSNWFGADRAMMEILRIALLFSVFLRKINRYAFWYVDDAYNSVGCRLVVF